MRVTRSYFAHSTGLMALGIALAATPFGAAYAQAGADAPATAQADTEEYDEDETIVVFGRRLLGQVDSPVPPLLELGAEEIAAYGSGSIAELIQALGPQTGSSRGRGGGGPALLVNGVRISSFREMRSYPPEAIEKIEIFSEEVAQRYGFSPDQRVINIILKQNFSSKEIEVEYSQPGIGGTSSQEVEATYLLLNGPSRLNFNVGWNNSSLLTEADRGIVQTFPSDVAGDPDPADYRSLRSDSAGLELTANWTTRIDAAGNSLSLNATYERDDSLGLQGLDTVTLIDPLGNRALRTLDGSNPLESKRRSQNFALGSTLNMGLGDWQVTTTLNGSHNHSRNMIDRFGNASQFVTDAALGLLALDGALGSLTDAGADEAITKSDSISSKITARGNPIYLPSGDVSLTFDTGYSWNRIQSRDTRNPGVETELKRGDLSAGVNLSVPITSRDEDFGGAIGNLSLNLNAGIDHLSDFGTLYDWTAGLNWGVTDWLNLSASYIARDAAPSLGQLGNPEVATNNVPVFDLARNETVLVTQLSGGNQNLPSQSQRDWKFGAQIALPFFDQASISIDYVRNHSDDVAAGFPVLTPEIEAAFPGRVTRDGFGQLVSLDRRAVTFAEQDVERLQFGINLSGQIGGSNDGERRGGFGGRGPGGGGGGPPGGGGGGGGGFRGPPPAALFGAIAGAGGPPSGDAAAPAAGGAPASGGGFGGGGQFASMRLLLCGENRDEILAKLVAGETVTTPDGEDVTIPPAMLERMVDENGEVNSDMVDRISERMCSAEAGPPAGANGPSGAPQGAAPQAVAPQGAAAPQGGPPSGGPGGGGGGQFAAMRLLLCGENGDENFAKLTAGEPVTAPDGQEVTLPSFMLDRIRDENGDVDPELAGRIRERMCSSEVAPEGAPAGQGDGPQSGAQGGFGGFGGFGRGGGGGGGGGNSGRWFFNLQYTRELKNETLISDGGLLLDLLAGSALSGGGQARHSLNGRLGVFYGGFGTFINGNYNGSSRINGSGLPGSTDLKFNDYATISVRSFINLGQQESLIEKMPFLDNVRIGIEVNNIFDARQRVTDSNGDVPLRYQPLLLDPIGRSFEIEIRKMF